MENPDLVWEISAKIVVSTILNLLRNTDFLEYQKYLIRNWGPTEGARTSYQQESSGDAVMEIIRSAIIQGLRRINNTEINRILDDAPSDWIQFYKYIHKQGVECNDLPILETIIAEYWKYVEKLKVFEKFQLIPDKLNVRNSDGVITVHGTISKPYLKKKGEIPIKIFYRDYGEVDKEERFVMFDKDMINGAISLKEYQIGEYDLVGYYKLKGNPTGRYEEPNSGRIPFTISNT